MKEKTQSRETRSKKLDSKNSLSSDYSERRWLLCGAFQSWRKACYPLCVLRSQLCGGYVVGSYCFLLFLSTYVICTQVTDGEAHTMRFCHFFLSVIPPNFLHYCLVCASFFHWLFNFSLLLYTFTFAVHFLCVHSTDTYYLLHGEHMHGILKIWQDDKLILILRANKKTSLL